MKSPRLLSLLSDEHHLQLLSVKAYFIASTMKPSQDQTTIPNKIVIEIDWDGGRVDCTWINFNLRQLFFLLLFQCTFFKGGTDFLRYQMSIHVAANFSFRGKKWKKRKSNLEN